MVFEFGAIIFIGFLVLGMKLPKWLSLRLLGHPVKVDIAVTAIFLVLHWGTMTGVMAATLAGLMVSLLTTIARYLIGYIEKGVYVEGKFALKDRSELYLKDEPQPVRGARHERF